MAAPHVDRARGPFRPAHLLRRRNPGGLPGVPGGRAVSRAARLGWRARGVRVSHPFARTRSPGPIPRGCLTTMLVLVLLVVPVWLVVSTLVTEGAQAASALQDVASTTSAPEHRERVELVAGARAASGEHRPHDRRVAGRPETRWSPGRGVGFDPRRPGAGDPPAVHHSVRAVLLPARRAESIAAPDPQPAAVWRGPARAGTPASGGSDLRQRDCGAGGGGGPGAARRTRLLGARPARAGRLGHRHGVLLVDPRGGRVGDLVPGGRVADGDRRR